MKTILVADDEDFVRLLVSEVLDEYRVVESRDGDDALARARELTPDLIVLDWMMPGRHGPDLVEALRADPTTYAIPVLVVSGRTGAAERRQMLAAGANACLAKPFGPSELRERVGALLASCEGATRGG